MTLIDIAELVFRLVIFVAILILPGGWIVFVLPIVRRSMSITILLSICLSPLVLMLQLIILSILHLSFPQAVMTILSINACVLYFLFRQKWKRTPHDWRFNAAAFLIYSFYLVVISPQLINVQARVYTGHTWMHSDIIYGLTRSPILLEESAVAGIRLSYPWAGHAYQAVLSYVLGSAPAANYIWTNIVWLGVIYCFSIAIVRTIGGSKTSMLTASLWLFLGLNFFGYPLALGDYRYTPWILKFFFFNQMPIALGQYTAMLYLLLASEESEQNTAHLAVLTLLLASIGIIYPILFPAAITLILGKTVSLYFVSPNQKVLQKRRQILSLIIIIFFGGLVFAAYQLILSADRQSAMSIEPNFTPDFGRKILDVLVALIFFWFGLLLTAKSIWRHRRDAITILLFGAISCIGAYIVILLPDRAEYKYMFTAAICLMPFQAIGFERVFERIFTILAAKLEMLPSMMISRIILYFCTACVLALPLAHKTVTDWPWIMTEQPRLRTSEFELHLDEADNDHALVQAIRLHSPITAMLVVENTQINLPTLTARPFFVAPFDIQFLPGVNVKTDFLLSDIKGYDAELIQDRRAVVENLYYAAGDELRADALANILTLGRPLVVIIDEESHLKLLDWLGNNRIGSHIYSGQGRIAWLVEEIDNSPNR